MRVEGSKHFVRRGAERRGVELVAADLLGPGIAAAAISYWCAGPTGDRERVLATTAHGGGVLGAHDQLVGERLLERGIERRSANTLRGCIFRRVADSFTLVV